MPRAIDIAGHKYGYLTVVDRACYNRHHQRLWLCRCDCGATLVVLGGSLRTGNTVSCGCYNLSSFIARITRHGESRRSDRSPTYAVWIAMRDRCLNEHATHWPSYGGRGIGICQRWLDSYEAFLSDMGQRPTGLTIDRIDPDGDYEPDNCRWATRKEQQRNRRITRSLTICGETIPVVSACEIYGIKSNTVIGAARRMNVSRTEAFYTVLDKRMNMPIGSVKCG